MSCFYEGIKIESGAVKIDGFLESIIENLPDMIFVKEAKTLQFVLLNCAGENLLGFKREELYGKSDFDFFPHEQASFFIEKDREVLATGTPVTIPEESINTRLNGTRILRTKKIPIIGRNGEPLFLLGISEDITAQKTVEIEAKKIRALENSNTDLQRFAAVVSHEIKEPIRTIFNGLSLLEKELREKLNSASEALLKRVLGGMSRLHYLVQDLSNYSRANANNSVCENFECDDAYRSALLNLESLIQSVGLKISCSRLPRIKGNITQIVQVFQNLISNAIKYRGSAPPSIAVCAEELDEEWMISVRDNGVGISPGDQAAIFEPFKRACATSSNSDGVGLGLAICRQIIERHGGRIWVESNGTEGSTFRFTLPKQGVAREDSLSQLPILPGSLPVRNDFSAGQTVAGSHQ